MKDTSSKSMPYLWHHPLLHNIVCTYSIVINVDILVLAAAFRPRCWDLILVELRLNHVPAFTPGDTSICIRFANCQPFSLLHMSYYIWHPSQVVLRPSFSRPFISRLDATMPVAKIHWTDSSNFIFCYCCLDVKHKWNKQRAVVHAAFNDISIIAHCWLLKISANLYDITPRNDTWDTDDDSNHSITSVVPVELFFPLLVLLWGIH